MQGDRHAAEGDRCLVTPLGIVVVQEQPSAVDEQLAVHDPAVGAQVTQQLVGVEGGPVEAYGRVRIVDRELRRHAGKLTAEGSHFAIRRGPRCRSRCAASLASIAASRRASSRAVARPAGVMR